MDSGQGGGTENSAKMNMPEERQCRGSKESTEGENESLGWEVAEEWKVPTASGKHEETFLWEGDTDGNSSGRKV